MGTVEKRDKHKKRRFVSPEEKLERELKDCMIWEELRLQVSSKMVLLK